MASRQETALPQHWWNFSVQVMFPLISKNDEFTDRFIRLYIANGTVGMLREWVEKDCPVSSEKMAEMMYSLSRKVIV